MFPNTAGSSEHSATGTPWFNKTGNGCMGIDDVKRCPQPLQCPFVGNEKKKNRTRTSFLKPSMSRFGTAKLFKVTYEIGHTSTAIPLSLHVSTNLGCFVSEYLLLVNFRKLGAMHHATYPCPIRFVPRRIASYRLMSASVPSPRVSPAWKIKGMSTPSSL